MNKKEKIICGLVVVILIIAFLFIQVILKGFISFALLYVLIKPFLIPLAILLIIEFIILIFNQKYRETRKKSLLRLIRSTQNLFRGISNTFVRAGLDEILQKIFTLVKKLVNQFEEFSKIFGFLLKRYEIKIMTRKIKTAIIKKEFDDADLRKIVIERFIERAKGKFK